MKKKKAAAKKKSTPKKSAPKKAAAKKAAPKKAALAARGTPSCQCMQDDDGGWFRFILSGGRRQRIDPPFDTQAECEENCP